MLCLLCNSYLTLLGLLPDSMKSRTVRLTLVWHKEWWNTRSEKERERHGERENKPPSMLWEAVLLAKRLKWGAGRLIMELACRVWAWVRPLYLNLEPRARSFLGVVAASVDVNLKSTNSIWSLSIQVVSSIYFITSLYFIAQVLCLYIVQLIAATFIHRTLL